MTKLNIKLGSKPPEAEALAVVGTNPPEEYFPEFHYSGDSPMDGLPAEGTMVIRYKKTGSSEHTGRDKKTRYSCDIAVKEIVSVDGGEKDDSPSKKNNETSDALDKIRAEKMKKKSEDSDESEEY